MLDIRRIDEFEAAAVAGLWDQMCVATPNGGPLSDPSRRNLQRMLEIMAWHRDAFCLAAVDPPNVYGFVCARVDPEAGLLPGMIGHVEESYVRRDVPDADGLRRRLVEAAVTVLRNRGARASCSNASASSRTWPACRCTRRSKRRFGSLPTGRPHASVRPTPPGGRRSRARRAGLARLRRACAEVGEDIGTRRRAAAKWPVRYLAHPRWSRGPPARRRVRAAHLPPDERLAASAREVRGRWLRPRRPGRRGPTRRRSWTDPAAGGPRRRP